MHSACGLGGGQWAVRCPVAPPAALLCLVRGPVAGARCGCSGGAPHQGHGEQRAGGGAADDVKQLPDGAASAALDLAARGAAARGFEGRRTGEEGSGEWRGLAGLAVGGGGPCGRWGRALRSVGGDIPRARHSWRAWGPEKLTDASQRDLVGPLASRRSNRRRGASPLAARRCTPLPAAAAPPWPCPSCRRRPSRGPARRAAGGRWAAAPARCAPARSGLQGGVVGGREVPQ
jgi:hypothetical protein